MKVSAPFVLALLLFAGCLDNGDGTPPSGTATGSSSQELPSSPSSTGTTSQPPPLIADDVLSLDGCPSGIVTQINLPRDLYPASPPPGWGTGPTPLMEVRILIYLCERISIGPFERGPLFILIETHGNRETPETCKPGEYDTSDILNLVWINDPEISAYLASNYGLPAHYAEFTTSQNSNGAIIDSVWTFGLPGGEPSILHGYNWTMPPNQVGLPVTRLYWVNQLEGISHLDLSEEVKGDSISPDEVTGTIRAPFIYAQGGIDDYVADGAPRGTSRAVAPITQFRDLECKEPL